MAHSVLVIGGTRYFGRLLVGRLLADGHAVTLATRGLTPDDFGDDVERVRVDRRDAGAMESAFSARTFDRVFDQMCYSPRDAAIAATVFFGRTGRYVMTSTIEVYDHLREAFDRPFDEADLSLDAGSIDAAYAWDDPIFADAAYGRGKREAEAVLAADPDLAAVSVRVGHVLGGPEDFTGRLASYVKAAAAGEPLTHSAGNGTSSFIDASGIAAFLAWVGDQTFSGPVNAAAQGGLSASDIFERAAKAAGRSPDLRPVPNAGPPNVLSPFDYDRDFVMSTARASELGYAFARTDDWLDALIETHLTADGRS